MNRRKHCKFIYVIFVWVYISYSLAAQNDLYFDALTRFEKALSGEQDLSFKDAIFQTENAYFEGQLSRSMFDKKIDRLTMLVQLNYNNCQLKYEKADSNTIKKYASIFRVMTDTFDILIGQDTFTHYPYTYDFDDVFGTKDWHSMLLTKLLDSRKGNCHSLPYLYKILADEIGVKTYLALAPNHIYIKQHCMNSGWYNTELTSASFPIDAWLMATGYITLPSVKSGVYLDTLSKNESLTLCLIDLANGYEQRFPENDGEFILKCCDTALKYFPTFLSGLLLKAETLLKQLHQLQKDKQLLNLEDVIVLPDGKIKWDQINELYRLLSNLGYKQMPESMYLEWLTSIQSVKDIYENR